MYIIHPQQRLAQPVKPLKRPSLLKGLKPTTPQVYWLAGALIVAGLAVFGVYRFSGNGNVTVLKQHLFGEIRLSSGTFPARSVSDLNTLSWDNGLAMLETLDTVNEHISVLEQAQSTSSRNIIRHEKALQKSTARVRQLLQDRKTLTHTAMLLNAPKLFTPEYEEYLHDTMTKLTAMKSDNAQNLVQN